MNLHAIRPLLLLLPFAIGGCNTSPVVKHEPYRDINIANAKANSDSRQVAEAPFQPMINTAPKPYESTYDFQNASNVSFGSGEMYHTPTPVQRRSTSRTNLIGLYGEIYPSTSNRSDPTDGNRNLTQVTFAEEGSCFDPDVDPTGQRLVFASTRHRDTADIYIKSTTGKTITQITTDPAIDLMPTFDSSGKRLAFASNRDGNWNIFITSIEGGRPIQLTSSPADELHPTWSPDGRYVAFCKFGTQSGRWEIWVLNVEKPGTQSFLDYGLFPRWSPDVAKNKILFQRSRQRGSRYHSIWTIDFVNGEAMYPTEIASAANAAIINPTWSPDGRRIAFVSIVDPDEEPGTPSQSDLWVVNDDGTNRTTLTNGDFANYQPVWAFDGMVYFVSNRSGNENIWAVSAGRSSYAMPRQGVVNVDPNQVGPPHQP
ncbi:MAG: hypothetical protein O7G85_02525 [Planctomycetota bacterium]|nr:hypothetical protein [Planctomycetota bacterium]